MRPFPAAAVRALLAVAFVLAGGMASVLGLSAVAATPAQAETRTLKMYYTHTKESIDVTFKRNGRYDKRGLRKLNRFLRDFRRNEPTNMDPALFDLVWEVYKKSGSRKRIHVISGYRSPKTNNMLRRRGRNVAKKSQHTLGKALDFFLPDVSVDKLRALGLKAHRGGVGYYRGSFVHLDTGRVRHWPRMSHRQLAKVFPRGRTIHVPSNGKPLKGYKTAMANLKKGRNADGSRRGSAVKTSLLARLFSRSGNDGDEDEGNAAPRPVRKPVKAEPKPVKVKPKPVQVAKAEPKLPKPRSGPNVFVSEATALKSTKSKAEEAKLAARIAADGQRALEQKRAADLARTAADATKTPEAKPTGESLIAALQPENTPRPVRRPRRNVGPADTLTALAPAKPANVPSPVQLALADKAPVPQQRVLRPRADVLDRVPDISPEATASVPQKVLKPVVEIESISRPEEDLPPAGQQAEGKRTLVAVAPGASSGGQGAASGPKVSEQQLAALATSVVTAVTSADTPDTQTVLPATLPQARPEIELPDQTTVEKPFAEPETEVAALVPAQPAITAPTAPSWRDGGVKQPIASGVQGASAATFASLPSSTAQPVAAIAISGGSALRPSLSLGDLDSRSLKEWAVAATTRTGPAAKLRAPDYSQSTRRAAPGAVYSEGFVRGRARWRSDRFSGDYPQRFAALALTPETN